MVQFKNPLTNPQGFFSSQPGGFFAPPQREGLGGFLSDPRLNIGLAIAQGQPIGQALLGGAIQAKQIEESFFPEATERQIVKGADGRQRYVDTGELVFPDVEPTPEEPKEYASKKAKDGFLRYTEGPDKGKKVFPDIGESTSIDFGNEDNLRDDFRKASGEFIKVRDSYGRILSTDPTGAGDLSLIFNYMKMLDPGSVVREGEFATAQNSAGVPDIIRAKYNQLREGTRLAEEQRADFKKQAENLYNTALDSQSYVESEFKGISEAYGFDPKRIVSEYGKPLEGKIFSNQLSVMSNEELKNLDVTMLSPSQQDLVLKELRKRN
jgi:hypothetical protein